MLAVMFTLISCLLCMRLPYWVCGADFLIAKPKEESMVFLC